MPELRFAQGHSSAATAWTINRAVIEQSAAPAPIPRNRRRLGASARPLDRDGVGLFAFGRERFTGHRAEVVVWVRGWRRGAIGVLSGHGAGPGRQRQAERQGGDGEANGHGSSPRLMDPPGGEPSRRDGAWAGAGSRSRAAGAGAVEPTISSSASGQQFRGPIWAGRPMGMHGGTVSRLRRHLSG